MFMLSTLGFGMITTGMVFGKSREGYRSFYSLTVMISFIVISMQAILSIPALSHLVFGIIIGLPPAIESPARITFFSCIPLNFLFLMRAPYQAAMYNGRATGRASIATFIRIIMTALMAPIFVAFGFIGIQWAVVCMTIPVSVEVIISRFFAKPFICSLKSDPACPASVRKQFMFNLPLAVGHFFLCLSGLIMGAFIARAPNPERMLPVYYLALGVVNPVAFGTTRIQAVVLAFPPISRNDRTLFKFAVIISTILGFLPLLFILPGLSSFYYVRIQNLSPEDLGLVRNTALVLMLFPLTIALRAHNEGLAAWLKRPVTVLAGQAVFLGAIVTSAFVTLALGVPGNIIGPIGILVGNLASFGTMRLSLGWEVSADMPVAQTNTAQGHVPPTVPLSVAAECKEK
jgi:hypothetical protein